MPLIDGHALPKGVPPHTYGGIDRLLGRIGGGGGSSSGGDPVRDSSAPLKLQPEPAIEEPPISLQMPTSSKYWRDESLAWSHHKGRAGVPPTDPSSHLKGRGVQAAAHEQYLRMQANVFTLVDENRALNGHVHALEAELEHARSAAADAEDRLLAAAEPSAGHDSSSYLYELGRGQADLEVGDDAAHTAQLAARAFARALAVDASDLPPPPRTLCFAVTAAAVDELSLPARCCRSISAR